MNVIFTCGGTAGHVNPALALAGFLRERDPKTRILFVGAERGLERDLIAHTPYPFRTVNISSFHRSLRPKELRHNLVSVRNLMHAIPSCATATRAAFRRRCTSRTPFRG